jgi:4-diphosphocytidyl-2-C-methyl-D-erythritol kinase
MIAFPNCKINLGLNVIRKRSDGYHDLETVFYPVQLCDVLEIIEQPIGENQPLFSNTGLKIDAPIEKNLCVKAYRFLQNDYNLPPVAIHLHKIIPFGAGLGGGSSDAAFTITSLNRVFQLKLSVEKMHEYAAKIGSDCSFFINSEPALAIGRGEILEKIDLSLNGWNIILIKPNIHISTAEAYQGIEPSLPEYNLHESIHKPVDEWKYLIHNDFEKHLFVKYPYLAEIKSILYKQGAVYAAMSGSGSTIFGLFKHKINSNSLFKDCYIWEGELK